MCYRLSHEVRPEHVGPGVALIQPHVDTLADSVGSFLREGVAAAVLQPVQAHFTSPMRGGECAK